MVLSDRTIKEEIQVGRIVIEPFDLDCVQPSSVDLRLDAKLRVFHGSRRSCIDIREPMEDLTELVEIPEDAPFILHPSEFILASTQEYVELPEDIVGRLEGKSSLGRLGLLVHSTAGYVDPGWKGQLTLELTNVAKLPITLYRGMKIAQLSFLRMTTPAERPYGSEGLGSRYQGQREPTASRLHLDFDKNANEDSTPSRR